MIQDTNYNAFVMFITRSLPQFAATLRKLKK